MIDLSQKNPHIMSSDTFFLKFRWMYILFMGSLISLSQTYGKISFGFQRTALIPGLRALSPENGFFRFTCGATPVDLLAVSMVASHFPHVHVSK